MRARLIAAARIATARIAAARIATARIATARIATARIAIARLPQRIATARLATARLATHRPPSHSRRMETQKTGKLLLVLTALLAILLAFYGKGYVFSGADAAGDSIDGITFPGQLQSQTFVGGGTRAKYGAVKVYAVGLYIDASRAASSLKPFVGLPAEKLSARADFFKVLQAGK